MASVTINGITYSGNNVVVVNGKVIIDGREAKMDVIKSNITINIEGNIEKLEADYCEKIIVKGDVNTLHSTSGNIDIQGNVTNTVNTISGDIECNDVGGNVNSTSGDINCHDIKGSVKTLSGDIKHRKR